MNAVNTASLFHSDAAISITHKFYDKEFMVYVEGIRDIPFWDSIFSKVLPDEPFKMESVNGKKNLTPYIDKIKNGQITNVIIACDSDYSSFMDTPPYDHPLIITTYGYSIENSMFCPFSVSSYIKTLACNRKDYLSEVNLWYQQFCKSAKKLLPYDIINQTKQICSTQIFGDNCCKFLKTTNSPELDNHKISSHINRIQSKFKPTDIKKLERTINASKKELRFIIKGHFLTNGIVNLIKSLVAKETHNKHILLSEDAIYGQFTDCHMQCKQHTCPDRESLFTAIKEAVHYLTTSSSHTI